MWALGEGESGRIQKGRKQHRHVDTTMRKTDSRWEGAVQHREPSLALSEDPGGGGSGGKCKGEVIYV